MSLHRLKCWGKRKSDLDIFFVKVQKQAFNLAHNQIISDKTRTALRVYGVFWDNQPGPSSCLTAGWCCWSRLTRYDYPVYLTLRARAPLPTCRCCFSASPLLGGTRRACRNHRCCRRWASPQSGHSPGRSWYLFNCKQEKKIEKKKQPNKAALQPWQYTEFSLARLFFGYLKHLVLPNSDVKMNCSSCIQD